MKSICKLVLLLPFIILLSCSDDDKNYDTLILGTWYQNIGSYNETIGQSYRNEIIFNSDGSYERRTLIIETANPSTIIGYLQLSTGDYRVISDKLYLSNLLEYGLDNKSDYLDREDLILSNAYSAEIQNNFTIENNQLIFIYSCASSTQHTQVLSLCLPEQRYNRFEN